MSDGQHRESEQTTPAPIEPREKRGRPGSLAARGAMVLSALAGVSVVASGHPGLLGTALLPAMIGAIFLGRETLLRRGWFKRRLPGSVYASAEEASIGLGATIGVGARVMPGAIVEMGASIGAGAVVERGAVVRVGASVHARAVIEQDAVVSWGADVNRGARVSRGARIGAGATVGRGAVVPADTWVMPGGDWQTAAGEGDDDDEDDEEDDFAAELASPPLAAGDARPASAPMMDTSTNSVGIPSNSNHSGRQRADEAPEEDIVGVPTKSAQPLAPQPIDPRQVKLDAVFTRIDSELALSPETLRDHLRVPARAIAGLRETCKSLLERERSLRAEADPRALARLEDEKEELGKKIAATDDEPVRRSLASAVAAIEEQKRQRQLLARSADRLDAEATRLFWTLDALAAQLVRMRSAGAGLQQAPDAELSQSLEQLQSEIVAIADALEQVALDDRRAMPAATQLSVATPLSAENASAPPDENLQPDGTARAGERTRR